MFSIQSQCEMISLESESGISSAAQAAKRLPHFFDNVKAYMAKSVFDPVLNLFNSPDSTWFVKGLTKKSYIDLQDVEVACPMGFRGDLVSYCKELEIATQVAGRVLSDNVSPFNEWLESKLGDPATLNAAVGSKVPNYKDLQVENYWGKLDHFFDKNAREFATTKYKHLVRRNNDWSEIVKHLQSMESTLNEVFHKTSMEQTNRLSANLDKLIERIEQDPNNYKLSPLVIKSLAERSYDCAKSVEFYALVRYKLRELQSALKDIRVKIESIQ